jgi:hypothetical protein
MTVTYVSGVSKIAVAKEVSRLKGSAGGNQAPVFSERNNMKRKLSNIPVLALLICLVTAVAAEAQRITSLTATAKGQGMLTVSGVDKHKINAVYINLKENGDAEITLVTDMQLAAQGQWSATDDPSKVTLKITGGVVDGSATGTGTLFLRTDGKSIDRLSIQAKSADGSNISVEFVADKKTASSTDTLEADVECSRL